MFSLKEILSHKSMEVTEKYLHSEEKLEREIKTMKKSSHKTCNFFTALVCTSMLMSPVTVNAAKRVTPVRYSTGIVTGAKEIETKDGNIWRTKRKLHLRKGSQVKVKFNTCGTRKKTDDKIMSVKKLPTPQITICHCDCVR